MVFYGIVKSCATAVVPISIVIGVILFHPSLPPNFEYESYEIETLELAGPLAPNTALNNAEKLFEGQIKGPEHLVIHNGELYTSTHGGYIYKITPKSLEPILKIGKSCDHFWQEHICGRPLGFEFFGRSSLYVADAYYGIIKYDLEKKTIDTLVDMNTEIEGKRPMLPNSLSVSKRGKVYWTDSSTTHKLNDGLMNVFGSPTGRLLVYDPEIKRSSVLMDNLHFPNGVLLSHDGNSVLVVETMRSRILRYYVDGENFGTWDVFVDKLPGVPDNLNNYGPRRFVVCLVAPNTPMFSLLPKLPYVRKFLARTLTMVQWVIGEVNNLYQTTLLERAYHIIGHFEMLHPIQKYVDEPRATCVILDSTGKITGSLHANDGNVTGVSGLVTHNGYHYLASPFNEYLARVKASS